MILQAKVAIKYCFITSLFILNLEATPDSNYEKYGTAFFTSIAGDSASFKTKNTTHPIHLHDSIIIDSESLLTTGDCDYVFFKLSNNTTFGLFENTQFRIQSFKQNPFENADVGFDREPSNSYFRSFLTEGTIFVESNILSPISVFEINLPECKLELYSVKCVISYLFNILHIALYEGNISLKKNDSITHINAPTYYSNDNYSLKNSINTYATKSPEMPTQWDSFKEYISIENNRVLFFSDASSSQSAAKAKLVISEDFYHQKFTRPRSFKKLKYKD
jgi:hypothetical protein